MSRKVELTNRFEAHLSPQRIGCTKGEFTNRLGVGDLRFPRPELWYNTPRASEQVHLWELRSAVLQQGSSESAAIGVFFFFFFFFFFFLFFFSRWGREAGGSREGDIDVHVHCVDLEEHACCLPCPSTG